MLVPTDEMKADLKAQEKELTDDISNLNKKVSHPRSVGSLDFISAIVKVP
jgi:hypothetical protein